MVKYETRLDMAYPYRDHNPCPGKLVKVYNEVGESRISCSDDLWWGYEERDPWATISRWLILSKERSDGRAYA